MPKRSASPAAPRRKRRANDVLPADTPVDETDKRTSPGHLRDHRYIRVCMSRDLTKRDVILICDEIEKIDAFAGMQAIPEMTVCEGGILLVNPANPQAYKSVRFTQNWNFPAERDDGGVKERWLSSLSAAMARIMQPTELFCKSNYYSPPWSKEELASVKAVLLANGAFTEYRRKATRK